VFRFALLMVRALGKRRHWAHTVAAGSVVAFMAAGGCVQSSQPDDSDAQLAFDKDAGDLDRVERYCLRAAQLFCAGLEPCCRSIQSNFERDICVRVRAEHCMEPAGYESPTFDEAAADTCLQELEHQFDDCQQPPGQGLMPISLHRRPTCDAAWSTTDPKRYPRYAPDELCGDGTKLCQDGYFCDQSAPQSERACTERRAAGATCSSSGDCASGLYCNEASSCEPVLGDGAACEYGENCGSAVCCGECMPAPAMDQQLCWIFDYPGGESYPSELGDATSPCVSIRLNAEAMAR
jgi:hypothetical protein